MCSDLALIRFVGGVCLWTVHDFYKNLNEFYSVVAEYDTPEACPTMSAGPGFVCASFLPSFPAFPAFPPLQIHYSPPRSIHILSI